MPAPSQDGAGFSFSAAWKSGLEEALSSEPAEDGEGFPECPLSAPAGIHFRTTFVRFLAHRDSSSRGSSGDKDERAR